MILNEKKGNLFELDDNKLKYTFDINGIEIIETQNDKYIGNIINTKRCGKLKVLYKINKPNYYICLFLNTNTVILTKSSHLEDGNVKDVYCNNIYGVACLGNTTATINSKMKKEYCVWRDMIRRCYDKNQINYKSYGGKGVYVSKRWLCFEVFEKDIAKIEGFDKNKFYSGELHIDKDIKSQDNNKHYSLETCKFVKVKENILERNSRVSSKRIKCINNNREFNSMKEASIWCNLKGISSITKSAKSNGIKYAGKHPETNEKLYWKYVD